MILKIEDVKAGDELVFIDSDELRCNASIMLQWRFYMSEKDKITVSAVGADVIYIEDSEFHITKSVLQYFKKKEQSQQYTFDDLIDVAKKAVRDGAVFNLTFATEMSGGDLLKLNLIDGKERFFNADCLQEGIDFIQSLYKETFVIETEEDISRVKGDASITFANGNKTTAVSGIKIDGKNTIQITHLKKPLGLFFLKGAIVEQDRGRNE